MPVGGGKSDVLLADMRIECDSTEYLGFIPYVLGMMAVYPFGIPGMYLALLIMRRKEIANRSEKDEEGAKRIAPLSFLWSGYAPKYWWWEVLEMVSFEHPQTNAAHLFRRFCVFKTDGEHTDGCALTFRLTDKKTRACGFPRHLLRRKHVANIHGHACHNIFNCSVLMVSTIRITQ